MSQAARQLERALDDMRRAQSAQAGDQASARRAAERMSEARDSLGEMRRQQSGDQVNELARRAEELASRQRRFEEQFRQAYPDNTQGFRPQAGQAPGKQQGAGAAAAAPKPPAEAEVNRLADEKAAISKDYERLEQSMREGLRALSGSDRQTATRLREALGEAQQNELGLRLKLGSDWLRRGLGSQMGSRERVATEMADRLSNQVNEARQMAGQSQGQGGGRDQGQRGAEARQALDRLQQARSRMESAMNGQGQGSGGQQRSMDNPGGQNQGGRGGGGGQQFGGGRDPRFGANQQRGGDWSGSSAMNDGTLRGMEQAWQGAANELNRLRQSGIADNQTLAEIDALIKRMEQLDPKRFPGNPELLTRLRGEILPGLQQLELRLRKDADPVAAGAIRGAQPAKASPAYADAVAEYYRRLSREK
jgi:hypothetical protein